MKKLIYASVLKLIAVILLVAVTVLGVLVAADGILKYWAEDPQLYSLEGDFSESWYVSYLLNSPESLVYDAYYDAFNESETSGEEGDTTPNTRDDDTTTEQVTEGEETVPDAENDEGPAEPPKDIAEYREAVLFNLERVFGDFENFEKINYFVQWNDVIFTNCGAKSAEELMTGEYHAYVKRESSGHVVRTAIHDRLPYRMEFLERYDTESTIVISCSIKDEAVREYKAIWERQEDLVLDAGVKTLVCILAAILLLIYLLCVCGKHSDGEYRSLWIDHVWLEVHLTVIAGAGLGAVALCMFVMDAFMSGNFPARLIGWAMGATAGLGMLLIITSLLSIVRNIKTRQFIASSLIFQILRWVWRLLVTVCKWLARQTKAFWRAVFRPLTRKTGIMFVSMLLVYTVLVGIVGLAAAYEATWILAGILLFLFACFVVGVRAKDLDEVKKGAHEVRGGNLTYQIPKPKCEDMAALAEDVNDIAKGLDESVSAKLKAERMKTELITNVSHDLKTPITSIISYTELLSKMEDLPEEAKDYVAVIAKKGDRLKNLTQDLFDISKVQSGNDEVVLEKLDVALLISQALAEQDGEIQASGLSFCVDTPKELYISADGRKMSRVVSNLIHNILKYTMKNTRVFITAARRDGAVELVFKNISAYPLNFNPEEITGRFVRGDESRTTEGNGLGLAIAKSYTELCGGTFEIVVDGDLFKAVLQFKMYS